MNALLFCVLALGALVVVLEGAPIPLDASSLDSIELEFWHGSSSAASIWNPVQHSSLGDSHTGKTTTPQNVAPKTEYVLFKLSQVSIQRLRQYLIHAAESIFLVRSRAQFEAESQWPRQLQFQNDAQSEDYIKTVAEPLLHGAEPQDSPQVIVSSMITYPENPSEGDERDCADTTEDGERSGPNGQSQQQSVPEDSTLYVDDIAEALLLEELEYEQDCDGQDAAR
ncbi:uncharacterized protein BJ171DRAFT_223220 [Polychytrium aggregatum]|uniref:uncharacterized protein n=1 Tax=Polychytrium aggregatum TaxID=110093 RepID=UPI0022FE4CB8|nr:uncharacterized protein BJ171DRAFT_223220 [Polychytrium aggregatum]KAI9197368.1 hypothetical protein BJ171DRAFT_223220 [Polychytrium aggregatum]